MMNAMQIVSEVVDRCIPCVTKVRSLAGLDQLNYIADQGLRVTKFERDHLNPLTYEFVRSFPLAISSMPVSYDGSSLLKCTVSMSYIRYVVKNLYVQNAYSPSDPFQQSQFNIGGFLGNIGGGLVDNVVDRVTGSDLLGDIAGGIANQAIRDAL